jgi:hypothetical protein
MRCMASMKRTPTNLRGGTNRKYEYEHGMSMSMVMTMGVSHMAGRGEAHEHETDDHGTEKERIGKKLHT